MAFDSTLGTRNASDTGQSLRAVTAVPAPGSSCVFMDGHVKWFRQGTYPSFSLRGGQPTASDTATVGMTALRQHTAEWQRQSENFRSRGITSTRSDALSQARLLAGLTPVQGPGVVVTLNDSKKKMPAQLPPGMAPPNLIYNSDINQVVNELKAAGAEAIAINGQRLVATSYIRPAGPTILINSTPTVPPYVIKAIGDSKTLASARNLRGGVTTQIKAYDPAMFSVGEAGTLTLPAYSGRSEPRYARPLGEEIASQNALASLQNKPPLSKPVCASLKTPSVSRERITELGQTCKSSQIPRATIRTRPLSTETFS